MSSWDWAALPHNILDEILDKLVNLPDYIRFASVCFSWRLAALDDRNHRGKKNQLRPSYLDSDHQLPMLMVPHWTLQNKAQFYSVTHEKILNFQLRVPFYDKRFIGSSFGWLISVDTDFMVTLFNPFSVTSVFLPPVLSSDVRSLDDGYYDINYFNHEYYFVKAILSADPVLHPDEYVVMLIYGDRRRFAFIRPGPGPGPGGAGPAPCWRYLELSLHGFCDVIYSKSSDLFYAVCETGEVCSIDIDKEKADCFTPTLKIAHPRDLRYIVETRSGDLLQVQRLLRESLGYRCCTGEIKVFKLEKTTPVSYWAELKSLGDNVLFVGDSTCMCVVASDFPGCRPGSVYFSQPFVRSLVVKVKPLCDCMDIDMGVANIEGKSVEPFRIRYENDVCNIIRDIPPIWVVPTFQRGKQDPKFILCIGD